MRRTSAVADTGEDTYLKENLLPLFKTRGYFGECIPTFSARAAFAETKKIGDLAEDYGIAHGHPHGGEPHRLHELRSRCRRNAQLSGA